MDLKWSGYVRNYSPKFCTIFDFSRGMIVLDLWLVRIGNFEDLKLEFGTYKWSTIRVKISEGLTCIGIWIIVGKVYCIIVVWKRYGKSQAILFPLTSIGIGAVTIFSNSQSKLDTDGAVNQPIRNDH